MESTSWESGWGKSWCNGIITFHHYRSTAHEVLGSNTGWVKEVFGEPQGIVASAMDGDVIIIPARVVHKNLDQSPD